MTTAWGPAMCDLIAAVVDLLVPQACAGCHRPGKPWCATCAVAGRGPVLRGQLAGGEATFSSAPHDGPVGRAVVAYKEGAVRSLVGPLGALLARSAAIALLSQGFRPGEALVVVPIPSRRATKRQRGADTTADLARTCTTRLRRAGVTARVASPLVHLSGSRDQVGLTGADRRSNMAGGLRSAELPAGRVILVDDVLTTGSTLGAAVVALREADRRAGRRARAICAATITASEIAGQPCFRSGGRLALIQQQHPMA